ncbi:hypothetical protein QZH41_000306, partial [Actinostola sp. cb2023]
MPDDAANIKNSDGISLKESNASVNPAVDATPLAAKPVNCKMPDDAANKETSDGMNSLKDSVDIAVWESDDHLPQEIPSIDLTDDGSRQKLLTEGDYDIVANIENTKIKRVDHTKSLGLIIDDRLSWSKHIHEI